MAKCSSCGAPLPSNKVVCAYCGTRNSVDLKKDCQEVPGEARTCPVCKIPMKTLNVGGDDPFLIEKCETCHGLFFDPGELDALLDKEAGTVTEVDYQRLTHLVEQAVWRPVEYRDCPVCGRMMNRVNFGTRSGVVVDRCRDHGVFLDAGELRQLIDWRKAGGQCLQDKSRERDAKRREKERISQQLSATYTPTDFSLSQQPVCQSNELNIAGALIDLFGRLF